MTPRSLKYKRKKLKIPQMLLAQRAGVGRYRISMFECGFTKLNETERTLIKAAMKKMEITHGNQKIKS